MYMNSSRRTVRISQILSECQSNIDRREVCSWVIQNISESLKKMKQSERIH